MKILKKRFMGFAIILLSLAVLSGCTSTQKDQAFPEEYTEDQTSSEEYIIDESDFVNGNELIEEIPGAQLSEEEIAGLILMREEEKLARDVYNTLGEKWGKNIFTNIAESEQTHTNTIKVLLDRYDIKDPAKDSSTGVFTSPELSELYKNLIEQGNSSLLDALIVGAIVEDLDIKDLNELSAKTNKADILTAYNNLNKGSRNHLRAYVRQIENNGGSYSPKYISQDEYESIIFSEQERGRVR